MPTNEVSDPITDQEIAFALLILSGAMTDRQAAEAVGLHPDSAAYTKVKPRVRAYMLEHCAPVQQQLLQQDADLSRCAMEEPRRPSPDREQVLARLWELAHLGPEMTRGSITGQVKAISMIVAIQNFIPDRRALSAEKKSAPALVNVEIYKSAWLREQQAATPATTNDPQPTPAPPVPECRGAQQEDAPARPGVPWGEPEPAPAPAAEPALSEVEWAPPSPVPSQPGFAPRVPLAEGLPPYVSPFAPDTRVPHSIRKNPFARPR